MNNFGEKIKFIWLVASLLRELYLPNQYKGIMFPMTVLRRLDSKNRRAKNEVS